MGLLSIDAVSKDTGQSSPPPPLGQMSITRHSLASRYKQPDFFLIDELLNEALLERHSTTRCYEIGSMIKQ